MYRFNHAALVGLIALAFALQLSSSTLAAEFSVQIGALQNPEANFAAPAAEIGTIHKSKTRSGLTRYQVGRFSTRSEANQALDALRAAGYTEAYVVQKGVRAAQPVARRATPSATLPDVASAPPQPRESDPLSGIPTALRDRVVVLDGKLHVREGDSFIPLDQHPEASQ